MNYAYFQFIRTLIAPNGVMVSLSERMRVHFVAQHSSIATICARDLGISKPKIIYINYDAKIFMFIAVTRKIQVKFHSGT